MTDLMDLDVSVCLDLLRSTEVGRVAVNTPTGPHIVPVNYTVFDAMIVFRTTPYSVVGCYGRQVPCAFEIDGIDPAQHRGWSVLARGRCDVLADAGTLDRLAEAWPQPWAGGQRSLVIGIRWTELTGRRIGPRSVTVDPLVMDALG